MQFLLNTEYKTHNARYYDSDVSIWLSVDPMAQERSWLSPYNYCQLNPVILKFQLFYYKFFCNFALRKTAEFCFSHNQTVP